MFKKYPFIKQKEAKNCGITCLMMIFRYYNGYVNPIKLEEKTNTTKNGTTAYHLIETLKYYGFEAKGIKCEIDDLKNQNYPAIAHVTIDHKYNHYIVIYKVSKNYLIIADPNDRVKKISVTEFMKIYNNILIIMSPKKELPKYFESTSKFTFFIKILKNYKPLLYKLIIFSFLFTIFSIANSFYLKFILDSIHNNRTLTFTFYIFIHFTLFTILTNYFRNKILIYISEYIDYDITTQTFKQIITLPYRYYASRTTGDIISRISDLDIVRETLSKIILLVFVDMSLITATFIALYFINSKLFFIALIILLLYVLVLFIYHTSIKKGIDECQNEKANITSYMVEAINNYENVKGLSITSNTTTKFEEKYLTYLKSTFKNSNLFNWQVLFKNMINELSFLIILYVGALEVNKGVLSIGSLMTFQSLLVYFLNPIKEVLDLENDITSSINALDRVLELYYDEKDSGIIHHNLKGKITFKGVNFSYDSSNMVLKNINLNINEGEKVLMLGGSGSGKSTILKMIKRYYQTSRNKIFLDDIDIHDCSIDTIDSDICYISQNENVYTDTLYNNIDLYRNIDSRKIYEMAKKCEIDFIDEKLGYHMLIEENGFNLSGGQKQRLILARSLLKKFNILLIDEATSQMDHNLERRILKNIFETFPDKTIIMVSHRIENMDLFDRMIRLEKGTIIERLQKNG